MNLSKRSKIFLIILLLILVVALPLTINFLQKNQVFQNFAWYTEQSVSSECSSTTGTAIINVTFSNTESSTAQDMNVVVNDIQTGISLDMGTVKANATKTMSIDTKKTSLNTGTVIFNLSWTSGASGTDTRSATYQAVNSCTVPPTNFCPDTGQNDQGLCEWDALSGVQGYNVVVTEVDTGTVAESITASASATQITFPMTPGKPYQCSVTPTNVCGEGASTTSPALTCPVIPTPTPLASPTPTVTLSPTPTTPFSPTPTPVISPTPTLVPTATPTPISTPTPFPTATPIPLPTPTPVVIVTVVTQPPQQTIINHTVVVQPPIVQTQTRTIFVTPQPTMPPTGNTTPTYVLIGASTILLLTGGLLFLLL